VGSGAGGGVVVGSGFGVFDRLGRGGAGRGATVALGLWVAVEVLGLGVGSPVVGRDVGSAVAVDVSVEVVGVTTTWVRSCGVDGAAAGGGVGCACLAASRCSVSRAAAAAATPVAATAVTVTRPVATVIRRTARSRAWGVSRARLVARVTSAYSS
jgi:hypothetical protein